MNPPNATDAPGRAGARPAGLVLAGVAAALVVAAAGLHALSGIFAPSFLALTLVLAARPLQQRLVAHRWHPLAASGVVLLGLYAVLLALVVATGFAVVQLSGALPRYTDEFRRLYEGALDRLSTLGVDATSVADVLSGVNLVALAGDLLDYLGAASSQVLLVVTVMFFLSLDLAAVGSRIDRLRAARPRVAAALSDFARRVRTYWVVATVFGLVVAVLDVIALALLGVPLALTWGLLAFVTNYIPNIGFVLGLLPPALLALLEGDVATMIWVIVVYSVINFTLQSLIQPKFVGDAVGLNPTVTFLSLVFWAFVVGPLGAILAVPLTLFFQSLLVATDPRTRWFNVFLESDRRDDDAARSDPDAAAGATTPRLGLVTTGSAEVTSTRPLACSRVSLEAGEDLHGTASTVSGYLVLEHGGPWGTKVLRDAPFSDPDGTAVPLGAHLSTVLGPLGVTTLLARRPGARHGLPGRVTVMLVAFDGTSAHGARTTVGAVSRLFGWKLPVLLATLRAGAVPDGWEPLGTQYLVCAHARRDACCGELGRPLVTALASLEPERTWEVSHVGGHRFAPNTLVLPEGLVYGRVPATRGRELVDAHTGGRLLPDVLRGRAGLTPDVQAAEIAVRRAAGNDRADDVALLHVTEDGARTTTHWSVAGGTWRAEVETLPGQGEDRPSSCGKDPVPPSPRQVVHDVAPE